MQNQGTDRGRFIPKLWKLNPLRGNSFRHYSSSFSRSKVYQPRPPRQLPRRFRTRLPLRLRSRSRLRYAYLLPGTHPRLLPRGQDKKGQYKRKGLGYWKLLSPSQPPFRSKLAMSSNSRKRKLGDEKKFYAVKAGKIPGVYTTWDDCRENITGFKGASCMSHYLLRSLPFIASTCFNVACYDTWANFWCLFLGNS